MRPARFIALAVLATPAGCTCSGPARDETVLVPPELSDAAALAILVDWQRLPVLDAGRYVQQSSADRRTGERPAIALWDHGNRDMNNFVCASADADSPPSRVPFVYDLDRCPEGYVRGVVLSRFEGSGRLSRLWLTAASFRNAPSDREVLRIWVDDRASAVLDVPLSQALDGRAGEMFAPPFGAGSTRRMAWYYPLVFSSKLVIAIDRLADDDLYFHQTDVVLDAGPKHRLAAPSRLDERDAALESLRSAVPSAGTASARTIRLAAGEEQAVLTLAGPRTITQTLVRTTHERLHDLERVIVEVRWDGAQPPALALPVLELFAASDEAPSPASPMLGSRRDGDRIELSLRLPMPFVERAQWTLRNEGPVPVELELALVAMPGVPSMPWGHLHAQRFETSAAASRFSGAHPLAATTAKGRLAGVCMTMHGHGLLEGGNPGHPMHFLEGDERAVIDGHQATAGTGTEDYFNGAFYFDDGPGATPFAQAWAIAAGTPEAPTLGRASACRWHVLGDAIDFAASLELTMEIGPGVPSVVDRYRSVAFLYQ